MSTIYYDYGYHDTAISKRLHKRYIRKSKSNNYHLYMVVKNDLNVRRCNIEKIIKYGFPKRNFKLK